MNESHKNTNNKSTSWSYIAQGIGYFLIFVGGAIGCAIVWWAVSGFPGLK